MESQSRVADFDKTSFTSRHELYRFKQMSFGLQIAPRTLQRAVDVILSTVTWAFSFAYFKDIFILTHSSRDVLKHVRKVSSHLRDAEVTLNLKKQLFHLHDLLSRPLYTTTPKWDSHSHDLRNQMIKTMKKSTRLRSLLQLRNLFRLLCSDLHVLQLRLARSCKRVSRRFLELYQQTSWRLGMSCRTNWFHNRYSRYNTI